MCSCEFLTWVWCLRLGHCPFFAPLVTFKSCHIGAYPPSFYLVGGVIHCLFVSIFWCDTRAYPLSFFMIDGFDFSLIWVIYWHFSDATLGIPLSFMMQLLFISFHFGGSSASCPDPLVIQRLFDIVLESPSHFRRFSISCPNPLVISAALRHHARIPWW